MVHHATLRGVDGEDIFRTDEDRIAYLLMLAATCMRYGWQVLCFCLMGNHVHLLVRTTEPNFGEGMRWLHGHYARCFNKQHGRRGHLFQDRYHDEPVLKEAHLIRAVAYITANPVTAGLCATPEEWPWGSHHDVTGHGRRRWLAHDELVSALEGILGKRAYERVVEAKSVVVV